MGHFDPDCVRAGFRGLTDDDGQPTPAGGPYSGPVSQGDPHTDVKRDRDRAVRVGLVDTRLFPHESLTGHYVGRAADILSPSLPVYTEFDGHCTFVASCILQQAPDATLYLRHVLNEHGDGTVWEAAAGIADLVPLDLDVVNLSFGEYMRRKHERERDRYDAL